MRIDLKGIELARRGGRFEPGVGLTEGAMPVGDAWEVAFRSLKSRCATVFAAGSGEDASGELGLWLDRRVPIRTLATVLGSPCVRGRPTVRIAVRSGDRISGCRLQLNAKADSGIVGWSNSWSQPDEHLRHANRPFNLVVESTPQGLQFRAEEALADSSYYWLPLQDDEGRCPFIPVDERATAGRTLRSVLERVCRLNQGEDFSLGLFATAPMTMEELLSLWTAVPPPWPCGGWIWLGLAEDPPSDPGGSTIAEACADAVALDEVPSEFESIHLRRIAEALNSFGNGVGVADASPISHESPTNEDSLVLLDKLPNAADKEDSPRIDRTAVLAVFERHDDSIRRCCEARPKETPELSGPVSLEFTIGPTGSVTHVSVRNNSNGDEEVGRCVTGLVEGWPFPKPTGGPVTLQKSLVIECR